MGTLTWYNGYSPTERDRNFEELKRQIAAKKIDAPRGPCRLCGDTGDREPGHFSGSVVFEYHNEDYSMPLKAGEPALYVVCRHCHVHKLHKRFGNVPAWHAFLAHVRRGGYARDLKDPKIAKEVRSYGAALAKGRKIDLVRIGKYAQPIGKEWFAQLRVDKESQTDPAARPT
jgi:hypothetical protein